VLHYIFFFFRMTHAMDICGMFSNKIQTIYCFNFATLIGQQILKTVNFLMYNLPSK
jgi:hypothetical protein